MKEIQELFNELGKSEINEFYDDLVLGGHIDSMDVINLVNLIEEKYGFELDYDLIVPENFANFAAIKAMIESAKGE